MAPDFVWSAEHWPGLEEVIRLVMVAELPVLNQTPSWLLFRHHQSTETVFSLLLRTTLHLYPFHRRGL